MVQSATDETTTREPAPASRMNSRPVWIATFVFIISLTLIRTLAFFWWNYITPEDDSWDMALNLFASRHELCGQDYVFTFGPLGFVYSKSFFPLTYNAKLAIQALFCGLTTGVMVAQGKALLKNPFWTALWIFGLVALYGFFSDVFFLAAPLLLINQHFLLDDRKKLPSALSFILVFLTALAAIVKFTFFVAGVWVIAFIALDELFVKKSKPLLTIAFAVTGLLAWLLAGQPLGTLVSYITSSLPVTSGHSEAMTEVTSPNWAIAILASIASAGLMVLGFARLAYKRIGKGMVFGLLALSGLFFLTFKAAYVRHTIDHEVIASSVYGFAALAMLPLILSKERNKLTHWAAAATVATMLCVALPLSLPLKDTPVYLRYPMLLTDNVFQVFNRIGPCFAHLRGMPVWNERYESRMQKIREENPLPKIAGSVDIYPTLSNVVIAHNFEYRQRPVFQSYLAYRQPLTKMNDDFLRSDKAASSVIIQELKDLYGYYPTLYDGPSWVELLSLYEPVSNQSAGLVLKKRDHALQSQLKPLEVTHQKLGEVVSLPQSENKILFAQINVPMTAMGSIQKLFFRVFPPKIEATLGDGSTKSFIAPSEIMKAGFLLTPFVAKPDEVNKLYTRQGLTNNEVKSFKISESKNELPWSVFSQDYTLELYELTTTP